jgi:hypothetical protein
MLRGGALAVAWRTGERWRPPAQTAAPADLRIRTGLAARPAAPAARRGETHLATSANAASTLARSLTSIDTVRALRPRSPTWPASAASSPFFSGRSASTTSAPALGFMGGRGLGQPGAGLVGSWALAQAEGVQAPSWEDRTRQRQEPKLSASYCSSGCWCGRALRPPNRERVRTASSVPPLTWRTRAPRRGPRRRPRP